MSPGLIRTAALAALLWVPAWVAAWPHSRAEGMGRCGRAPAVEAKRCCGAHQAAVSAAPEVRDRCLLCDLAAGGVEPAPALHPVVQDLNVSGASVAPQSSPIALPLAATPPATGPPAI